MAKILLIEDDTFMAATVAKMLAGAGHKVVQAENGAVGLESYAAERPDLVITDIVMPERDGLEAITELLALAPHLPIIAVSGGGGRSESAGFLVAAKQAGAREVMAKPFRLEALLAAVGRCTGPQTSHRP